MKRKKMFSMKKMGVSIYPEKSTFEKDKAYLDLAHKYGFKRVFTSLLQIKGDAEAVIADFKKIVDYANTLEMEVMVDINPRLFEQLGISYDDLSFFKELGAYGVRLDGGFGGIEEKRMTLNPYGIKVEVNMSMETKYFDHIMSYFPNRDNLMACHNFYPRNYTGLSQSTFETCNTMFNKYGVNTAAFVTSQVGEIGPWAIQDGLPTLEAHRNMGIKAQVNYFKLIDTIDDILIGNAYASEAELKAMSEAFHALMPAFDIVFDEETTELEKEIVLKNVHFYRGDRSDYVIRSSMTRFIYRDRTIKPHATTKQIRRGDIIIDNDKNGQYKGELFVALKDMENDGRTNVVARLTDENIYLLDFIQPFASFNFSE